MNLAHTVELYLGGPGSGCNPDVGKCGRPSLDKPESSGSVFNTYDIDSSVREWVLEEMSSWKFDTGTEVGRLGQKMKAYIDSELSGEPNPSEHFFIQKTGSTLTAVGTYLWEPDIGLIPDRKEFIVASLVMNPKYLGSGAIKDVIRNIKNHAEELGTTKVWYSRLDKGVAKEGITPKDIQSSVSIYIRAALEEV